MKYKNGDDYFGEWKNGRINGKGIMTYDNGAVYNGGWRNEYYHGKGILTDDMGIYDGDWEEGQRDGQGTQTYKSGDVYKGEWMFNWKHGFGTFTCKEYPGVINKCHWNRDHTVKKRDYKVYDEHHKYWSSEDKVDVFIIS